MHFNRNGNIGRAIILALICVPVIIYLLNYANKKSKESGPRMQQCQTQCLESGAEGYEFKWGIFGEPTCDCISSI